MLFLIGAAFGLRRGDRPSTRRWLACAIAANALAGIGLPALCYALYPAWMWGYYIDPTTVSPLGVIGLFALYWIPFAIGLATHSWGTLVAGLVAQIGLIAWQWPRYSTVTTLEEFHAGLKVPPAELPLLAWGGPAAIFVVVALLWFAQPRRANSLSGS